MSSAKRPASPAVPSTTISTPSPALTGTVTVSTELSPASASLQAISELAALQLVRADRLKSAPSDVSVARRAPVAAATTRKTISGPLTEPDDEHDGVSSDA